MNYNFKRHLISVQSTVKQALEKLDQLAADAILFVVDEEEKLIGSLTDGDVRRGLLKDLGVANRVEEFIQPNPKFIKIGEYDMEKIIAYRDANYRIIPVLDKDNVVVNVINFRFFRSYLPVDAVIMAGGRGQRLQPLTDTTPKPMLKVGDKPIIEYNIDRLALYGIDDFWISVKYLGEQIEEYFGQGEHKNVNIQYIRENEPLGTIGAISNIESFTNDYVIVLNSDLLTNLDYEDFFLDFLESGADFSVVSIPYDVSIPYAVLETSNRQVTSFIEKPTYTYYSNGGIYLMKKSMLESIPKNTFFNATDLMETLIGQGKQVNTYPLRGYWLDIGKHEDFKKAQEDIKHIKF